MMTFIKITLCRDINNNVAIYFNNKISITIITITMVIVINLKYHKQRDYLALKTL